MKNFCGSAGEGITSESNILHMRFYAEQQAVNSTFSILYTAFRDRGSGCKYTSPLGYLLCCVGVVESGCECVFACLNNSVIKSMEKTQFSIVLQSVNRCELVCVCIRVY